jgi:hypothetical protein
MSIIETTIEEYNREILKLTLKDIIVKELDEVGELIFKLLYNK